MAGFPSGRQLTIDSLPAIVSGVMYNEREPDPGSRSPTYGSTGGAPVARLGPVRRRVRRPAVLPRRQTRPADRLRARTGRLGRLGVPAGGRPVPAAVVIPVRRGKSCINPTRPGK